MEFADGGDLEVIIQYIQKVIDKKKKMLAFTPEAEIWKMAK